MKTAMNCRKFFRFWVIGSLFFVILTIYSQSRAADLHSPWDSVPARGQNVEQQCPVAPSLSPNLSVKGYYEHSAGSVVNKKRLESYSKSTASYRRAAIKIVSLADKYRETGDAEVAQCAATWLEDLADDNALGGSMKGAQAEYVRAWMLNAYAISWLKVRPGIDSNNRAVKIVPVWLSKLAHATMNYHDKRNSRNNLRYWAGLAVMSAGIASNQAELFDWGVNSFRIGADQIDKNGILPLELKRGARSEHYHFFAAGPLVMMAELASSNDKDLYAVNDDAVGRLISLTVGIATGMRQLTGGEGGKKQKLMLKPSSMVWLHSYAKRFPNPQYEEILKQFNGRSSLYLGGVVP